MLGAGLAELRGQTMKPVGLTCEGLTNPLGIDIERPAFSWNFDSPRRNQRQVAYEVLVSDNLNDIKNNYGNVYSTGKINSSQNIQIPYAGSQLKPFTRYYWRVRITDQDRKISLWSDPAWFETAHAPDATWKAKWISDGSKPFATDEEFYKDNPAPIFRKIFTSTKKLAAARLYVSGVGYFEAYINGKKAGDEMLAPGWTSFSKHIQYSVYDVTRFMKQGKNVAGIMLGNGWYNPLPLKMWGVHNLRTVLTVGQPAAIAELRLWYSDGSTETIITDESWRFFQGPIIRNNVYLGEHYDARAAIDNWSTPGVTIAGTRPAVVVNGPEGKLVSRIQPGVKVTKVLKPIGISEPKPGVYVFDMGQNFAGTARIKVKAPSGTKITMRYGEDIYKDGNINVMTSVAGQVKSSNGGPGAPPIAWQEDSYIAKGAEEEIWAPRFTFHGFRYIEVSGWPGKPTLDNIEGLRMNADVGSAGSFVCSNKMFNQLHNNIEWTFLSNVFSVQSDCPAREKFQYGGDMFCTTDAFLFNFDMANFYRKVVQDFEDAQRPKGGIPETAPYMGIADSGPGDKSGPLGFQIAFPFVVKKLYEFYGNTEVIRKHYDALTRHVNFLIDSARNHLYDIDLSDHESLDKKPIAFSASTFYYLHLTLMAELAGIIGKAADQSKYLNESHLVKRAILEKFFDAGDGIFDNGTQTAQVFGLWPDLISGKQRDGAISKLLHTINKKDNHLSTGIFGTKMMFDVLRVNDKNEIAYTIANQRDFPGWGYMIDNGATTLWETWAASDNVYSKNHPMFGSVSEWMYRSLLGINPDAPAFKKILIKPQPAGDLQFARGNYRSVTGMIGSAWEKTAVGINLDVEIPANSTAEIWVPSVPGSQITEGGLDVSTVKDVNLLKIEKQYTVFEVGSGKYSFKVKNR